MRLYNQRNVRQHFNVPEAYFTEESIEKKKKQGVLRPSSAVDVKLDAGV